MADEKWRSEGNGRKCWMEFEHSIQPLLKAMKTGNPLSTTYFDRLFGSTHRILHSNALSMLRRLGVQNPVGDADDAVQTWDYKMISKGFAQYIKHNAGRPFFPYGTRALWRICIDIRKQQRATLSLNPDIIDARLNPIKSVIAAEASAILSEALNRLSMDERETIRRRFWDQLRVSEYAADLSVNPATLAVRLHRGIQRLRSDLEDRKGELWPCNYSE
jgi:RNA polymerase sigma factor (sigma-70 family)